MIIINKGNLSLRNKTFINREALPHEIEIVKWNDDKEFCWTIASFEKDNDEEYYVKSCKDRLKEDIDWVAFGELVEIGYEYLKALTILDKINFW